MGRASRLKNLRRCFEIEPTDFEDFEVIDRQGDQWLLLRKSTGRYYIHAVNVYKLKYVAGWYKIVGDRWGGLIIGIQSFWDK